MKFEQYLLDQYHSTIKSDILKMDFDLYKNPKGIDFKEVGRTFRWLAYFPYKNLYIWKYDLAFHLDVINHLFNYKDYSNGNIICGIYSSGSIIIDDYINESLKKNWSFIDRYIPGVSKYIKTLKEK